MLGYLSLDIVCSLKRTFSSSYALGNCSLLGIDDVRGQISAHIFAPNGGYCLSKKRVELPQTVSTGLVW